MEIIDGGGNTLSTNEANIAILGSTDAANVQRLIDAMEKVSSTSSPEYKESLAIVRAAWERTMNENFRLNRQIQESLLHHELAHTAHFATAFFSEHVEQHDACQSKREFREAAEKVSEALADFYQLVSTKPESSCTTTK